MSGCSKASLQMYVILKSLLKNSGDSNIYEFDGQFQKNSTEEFFVDLNG